MNKLKTVLAFDLGASSGRAIISQLDAEAGKLTIQEIHRFPNDPVQVGDHLHWDILRLFHEIKQGILKAKQLGYTDITSIGIDTWAVDFGLLDASGELLGNPYHYRDHQTDGIMEEVWEKFGKDRIFKSTGLQFLQFNTLYQLYALKKRDASALANAKTLLMIPDLLRYFLTGDMASEYTNASTTQLLNPLTGTWDESLVRDLGLPEGLLLPPTASGTKVGVLSGRICRELSVPPIPVVTVGEHDTASAVAAVPAVDGDFAYLSCGTWSLLGTELSAPVINGQAQEWNFTNEGGVYGTNRLLKNIMGLWLLQESKRAWDKEGLNIGFAELVTLSDEAAPFRCFIDPDDDAFLNPVLMPTAIQEYCKATNQYVPETPGEIARCITESLALKYRLILERTEALAGVTFQGLHIVGGGIQNRQLCQLTANAIQRDVLAGPIEASALGNIVVQYIAAGEVSDLTAARKLIRGSFPVEMYRPQEQGAWQQAYERFREILSV